MSLTDGPSGNKTAMASSAKGTPWVSVLMITRNHGAFLSQAIDSVLAQTRAADLELELLIGEDGSDDDAPTMHGAFRIVFG